MDAYDKLYRKLLKASVENNVTEETDRLIKNGQIQDGQLDLFLHPLLQPVVISSADACKCEKDEPCQSQLSCLFSAIKRDKDGKIQITDDCTGCAQCLENCLHGVFKERKDIVPLFEVLNARETPVYAMIAPAFLGQFGESINSGKLRAAFKKLGFYGMIEVALFADLLTLKEALEFDAHIKTKEDFLLTSCCCPLWVIVIRKMYSTLVRHVPPSVSPMVACGRSIKKIHPDAITVFIGPCLAKKAEAKEPDICDAVDFVLTFREMQDIFEVADIDPNKLEEDYKDHSSRAGRIYARTGGVSEAVEKTLSKLKGSRAIPFVAKQASGMVNCKNLLEEIAKGDISANFLEGMGCAGGCVGGPRVMINPEEGRKNVNEYGDQAIYETPVDNPYILELLNRLGYETAEALLEEDNMFIREFGK
ncbi:MAG: [Fe-Fe] hydrogenase large subunit C-terminal domain-containing protein [Christensenellales bacterium]